ncbi:MAG: hypothetical protein SXQ77_07880 [Halobacteria archaeon]|nr:hypothetical protein [Halobacteria archaeon]
MSLLGTLLVGAVALVALGITLLLVSIAFEFVIDLKNVFLPISDARGASGKVKITGSIREGDETLEVPIVDSTAVAYLLKVYTQESFRDRMFMEWNEEGEVIRMVPFYVDDGYRSVLVEPGEEILPKTLQYIEKDDVMVVEFDDNTPESIKQILDRESVRHINNAYREKYEVSYLSPGDEVFVIGKISEDAINKRIIDDGWTFMVSDKSVLRVALGHSLWLIFFGILALLASAITFSLLRGLL